MRRVACGRCGGVKRERLTWLADNPYYTKRFAFYVGRRCRDTTIKAVAEEVEKRRSRARPYSPAHGARPNAPRPASSSLLYNAVV